MRSLWYFQMSMGRTVAMLAGLMLKQKGLITQLGQDEETQLFVYCIIGLEMSRYPLNVDEEFILPDNQVCALISQQRLQV